MKKILLGLFIFGFLTIGAQANAFSLKDAVSLRIQSLNNEIIKLTASLKASALDPLISVTPASVPTPRISYWWGKVNQHVDIASSTWQTDPDGSSGASIDKLTYCKKWYPNTTSVSEYKIETINSWHDAGNLSNYTGYKMSYNCVESVSIPSLITIRPADYVNGIYGDSVSDDAVVPVFAVTVLASAQASIEGISIMSDRSGISSIMSDFKINDGMTMGPTKIITKSVRGPFYNANGTTQYDLMFDDVLNANQTKTYVVYAKIENGASGSFRFGIGGVSHSISLSTVNGVGTWGSYRNIISSIPPSITVLSPNGGESIEAGSKVEVRWSSTGIPSNTQIYITIPDLNGTAGGGGFYSTNDGSEIISFDNNISTGTYTIEVGTGSGPNDSSRVYDRSDNRFTIRASSTTTPALPVISAPTVNSITTTSAVIGANPISLGVPYATTGSMCIDTSSGRTGCNTAGISNLLSRTATGLLPNTTYYFSGNAINSAGTGWSPVGTFKTLASNTTPSIKVLSPNGGETYTAGQQITIKWESKNIPLTTTSPIEIGFANITANGMYKRIDSYSNDGIEVFSIPLNFSGQFIASVKTSQNGNAVGSESNIFTINSTTDNTISSLTILSPIEGKRFNVGDQLTVKWESVNVLPTSQLIMTLENVNNNGYIIYLTDDKNIPAIFTINDGIEEFKIPTSEYANVKTGDYRINLSGMGSDGKTPVNAISGIFTIIVASDVTPLLSVLSPNGGEVYKAGQQIVVKWKTENIPSYETVLIEITKANKPNDPYGGWTTLTVSTPNDGIQTVSLGNDLLPGNYQLAVKRNSMLIGDDISDGLFIIKSADDTLIPTLNVKELIGNSTNALKYENKEIILEGNYYSYNLWRLPVNLNQISLYPSNNMNSSWIDTKISSSIKSLIIEIWNKYTPTKPDWLRLKIKGTLRSSNLYTSGYYLEANQLVELSKSESNDSSISVTQPSFNQDYSTPTYGASNSVFRTPILRTLRSGVKGDDVKRLQEFLNLLADGSFGPKTAAKVKEWQAANGLKQDGLFGKMSSQKAGLDK